MVVRAFILIAGAVMAAGFLWFAGNIIRLGLIEFFKSKNSSATPATPTAAPAPSAPAPVPTTAVPEASAPVAP